MSCATPPAKHELAVEWYGVGNAWLAAGKYADAGKAYDRALSLDPGLIAASYNAARALVEAASYDKALAIADTLIAGDTSNLRFIGLRAYVLYKAGRAKEAAEAYEAAFALDEWAPDIVYNSSLLLLDGGEAAKAADRLAPLALAKPDDDVVIALYARALAGAGRDAEAVAAWEDLRSLGKIDAESLEKLGALYEKTEDIAKAIDAYGAAGEKDPKRGSALFSLARLKLTKAEDGQGGLDALAKALAAGFADKTAAVSLLSLPGLLERAKVATALAAKGLIGSDGSEGGATTGDAKVPGAPPVDSSSPLQGN